MRTKKMKQTIKKNWRSIFSKSLLLILIFSIWSCKKDIGDDGYVKIENSFQNKIFPILKSKVENNELLDNSTIIWENAEFYYRTSTGYFIAVPFLENDRSLGGRVMFEKANEEIYMRIIYYNFPIRSLESQNISLNSSTHEVLNYFSTINSNSMRGSGAGLCSMCHWDGGTIDIDGVEVTDTGSGDDFGDWDNWGDVDVVPVGGGGDVLPSPWSLGDVVAYSPDNPIANLETFLDCLDSALPASLTIYVAEPNPGTGDTYNGNYVGHTFISLNQGVNMSVLGFYPTSDKIFPIFNASSSSVIGNDGVIAEYYSTSITTSISPDQLEQILDAIINHNSTYDLNTYNCTDFGIEIGNLGGLNLPNCNGTWPGGSGSNPGTLGEYIRNMSPSSNTTVNTDGGEAPLTRKSC